MVLVLYREVKSMLKAANQTEENLKSEIMNQEIKINRLNRIIDNYE